jgi:hypothetical protein
MLTQQENLANELIALKEKKNETSVSETSLTEGKNSLKTVSRSKRREKYFSFRFD